MGAATKGVIAGTPTSDEIWKVIRDHLATGGDVRWEKGKHDPDLFFFDFADGLRPTRILVSYAPPDPEDTAYPCELPSVLVRMAASEHAVPLVERVVAEFGGFVNDSDIDDDWRRVEMLSLEAQTPAKKFDQALDRLLTAGQAAAIRALAHDDERLDALMDAIAEYRETRAPGVPTP